MPEVVILDAGLIRNGDLVTVHLCRTDVAIPFARAISPITHSDWEGTSVTPDVIVSSEDALKIAYNAALESAIKATTDVERKEKLKKLLTKQFEGTLKTHLKKRHVARNNIIIVSLGQHAEETEIYITF